MKNSTPLKLKSVSAIGFLLLIVCLFACKPKASYESEKLDLLQYGVALVIDAPKEAEVKVDDLGVWKDVSIKKGDDYYIQIICSQAATINVQKIKQDQIEIAKEALYFSKIIQEDEEGFIFEKVIDENTIDYDFRHIKIQGDNEYIFQTGLIGTFNEAQVREMYQSVQ